MNCPACGGPMRLDRDRECLVCEFCNRIHFPEQDADGVRLFGQTADLLCPVCQTGLEEAAIGRQGVQYCSRCRGMLIGMWNLLAVVQELRSHREGAPPEAPHPFQARELNRSVRCPGCGDAMDTHPYAGPGNIVIDSCSRCHLDWLDHGELMRIVRAPDSAVPET